MGHDTDDWPEGCLITVPHAWRDDDLWRDMQAEARERIGTRLRELYSDLLHQPLSSELTGLIREIEGRRGNSAIIGNRLTPVGITLPHVLRQPCSRAR